MGVWMESVMADHRVVAGFSLLPLADWRCPQTGAIADPACSEPGELSLLADVDLRLRGAALELQPNRAVLSAEQLLTLMLLKTGPPLALLDRQQHQCQDPPQHSPRAQAVQRKT